MKKANKPIAISIVLMLSAILITTAFAYPISDVTMNVVNGTDSYFLTTLTGIPAGEDISDGTYPGWCVDVTHAMPRSTDLIVTLYSSLDPPASLAGEAWDMVNYILNNKVGSKIDVQAAIWYFLKLEAPTPGYYAYDPNNNNEFGGNPPSANTMGMVADALANGAGFTPGPGDVLAVICMPDDSEVQISIVELEIPKLPGYTPGFWKHNIGVALGYNPGSYSAFNDGTKLTKAMLEGFADTVGVSLEEAYDALNTKGQPASTRIDMANDFNDAAGYGPFED